MLLAWLSGLLLLIAYGTMWHSFGKAANCHTISHPPPPFIRERERNYEIIIDQLNTLIMQNTLLLYIKIIRHIYCLIHVLSWICNKHGSNNTWKMRIWRFKILFLPVMGPCDLTVGTEELVRTNCFRLLIAREDRPRMLLQNIHHSVPDYTVS